ncbi:minor tail protein [Gordonia phage Herod]|uniref:Minor tail protein n=5 Tax=Nymphadoravirus TaxID=2169636 RepID=A0A142KAP4_9CAUD|nr:minor tail protein [Gordonia phage Nymphadora]YP_010652883.1 minor tail protein [Gordonia phage Herod]AOE43896.1 minor tail protein [Gordonia phage BatStarr]QDP43299.1 minor tail protein [Gordonia phage Eviarto]QDP43381.1 minor tail protein [Gordonia phage TimTam]AMS03177.1 minor tail protein [Gordonia phage Nymphadora]QOP67322.1 minor tail protein [Gordonia phage Herod]
MLFEPRVRLTDLYGTGWELSTPTCPVRLISIKGLDGANWEFDKSTGVGQPGITINGRDDKESIVEMEVWVGPVNPGDEALTLLRRWRKGLGRGMPRKGRLIKLEALASGRFIVLRMENKPDTPNYAQMYHVGRTRDAVKLLSEESWWRTDPFDKTFASAGFATIKVPNYGDEDSWPWYRLTGPISNIAIGMAGETVTLPASCNLTAGQWLEIDTDPDRWHVTHSAGGDRTWKIGERWRVKAPAEEPQIPVTITGTGITSATTLRVVVPQLFHAAL